MLDQEIADNIQHKVTGLVGQQVIITDSTGNILSPISPKNQSTPKTSISNGISFKINNNSHGYIVMPRQFSAGSEVITLIQSIAELVVHQSAVISQLPVEEEQIDALMYSVLTSDESNIEGLVSKARLLDIDLVHPRIVMVISIEDPELLGLTKISSSNRELRVSKYKASLQRSLSSFYTLSKNNIITYIGQNNFCIFKDIVQDNLDMTDTISAFKKSLQTIFNILQSDIKLPIALGAGNYHATPAGIPQGYLEARSALDLGKQTGAAHGAFHIDSFGIEAPLLTGIDEQNIYFSRKLLKSLSEHEELIPTLESFFKNNMNMTSTSLSLHIHRNTLVYRLDKIQAILSLDPRQFDDASNIYLAILFAKYIDTRDVYAR